MVGNEGMVPLSSFFGLTNARFRVIVQNAGLALRMDVEKFHSEVQRCSLLHRLLLGFSGAFVAQVSHAAACNQLHTIRERYCRWLLMTHDRVGADQFFLKQAWSGMALGVRRMSITPAARALQNDGLIRYRRGRIAVLDRQGLERRACECYRRIFVLGDPGEP
jgi:CRP-like cAMP-binding protein